MASRRFFTLSLCRGMHADGATAEDDGTERNGTERTDDGTE